MAKKPQVEFWVEFPSGTVRCTHLALRADARKIVEKMILGPNPRREICDGPVGGAAPSEPIHMCRFVDGRAEEPC